MCRNAVLCRLYHAFRQPTRLGTAPPVSTPLSVKIGKKVGGPKAVPPKRVLNCDVIHVTGITVHDIAFWIDKKKRTGAARTQTPTTINCAPEFPTFGEIADLSPNRVQWRGLILREPPS